MSEEQKYSEGGQLLREIVDHHGIPAAILRFWNRLAESAHSAEGWNVISVLNTMSKRKQPENVDLMAWYEIFRDIYVMRARKQESLAMPVKVPLFTTFDRTFEQLAFLPDFWFGRPGGAVRHLPKRDGGSADVISPSDLLFSFERYMYDQDGGACWSALDWVMAKYCFRVVCEPARRLNAPEPPLLKIASLLLAAHYIVNGKLGLYVGERTEVDLPYAGISGGSRSGSPLLKYYHFDRFTRFSFIRGRELELDADRGGLARLEPRWQELAAMTEFILQSKSARATRTTCSRVGINAFISVLNRLRAVDTVGGDPELRPRIDQAIEMLDAPWFADMPPGELLREIGVHFNIIPCDYYLRRQQLDTAEKFWRKAEEVFRKITDKYDELYFTTIEKFTAEEYARRTNALIQDDCAFLMRALAYGHLDELRGRMNGIRLRSALKTLVTTERLELECGQVAQMLNNDFPGEKLLLHLPAEQRETALPCEWLIADVTPKQAVPTLRSWACEILSEFSRDPKSGEIIRDYAKLDMSSVQRASDRLWNIYFGADTEDICRYRWMVSLVEAIAVLEDKREKLRGVRLPEGKEREELISRNRRELGELSGGRAFDTASAKKRLAAFDGYTLGDVTPGHLRSLVIMDLIARLMVTTAEVSPFDALWSNYDELRTFFTHLLCATGSKLDQPFPFHVGIHSDATLRLSRNNNQDQRDNIDRLLRHKYDNGGERCFFMLMLLKYLKHSDSPERTLDAVIGNPAMAEYASRERLAHLREYLGGR